MIWWSDSPRGARRWWRRPQREVRDAAGAVTPTLRGSRLKLAEVIGARPQFIKAAAVFRAIEAHNAQAHGTRIDRRVIHTGQHYDKEMSSDFFTELRMPPPDHHLGVRASLHGAQTGQMLERVEAVLRDERPDAVLVYGDTNTTLAGALAAVKLHIPVAHVEAGIRSYNRSMAEETNRVVTDHVSSWLFCPSEQAQANLKKEGLTGGVFVTGDVMYDVFRAHLPAPEPCAAVLHERRLVSRNFALATLHRAENTDDYSRLSKLIEGLEKVARDVVPVVLPLHPRTKKAVSDARIEIRNVQLLSPLPYEVMLCLQAEARFVLTDSGGMQKEAYWLGVPCVTLRDETEWVETVTTGWNRVVGADPDAIVGACRAPIPSRARPDVYGRGDAARRIVELLVDPAGT